MKTIFDCETEIGTCELDCVPSSEIRNGDSDPWKIYVHTRAALTRTKGMLRIEQRCFFRSGNEVSDHPDVKSDMILEPALDTDEESLSLVRGFHSQFTARVRQQLTDTARGSISVAAP